jgi:hypothetical protein
MTSSGQRLARISKPAFSAWLAQAAQGQEVEYHRGNLVWDRGPASALPDSRRRALCAIADAALEASVRGLVHLVQRRRGPFDFSYVAIKASPSSAPPAPLRISRQLVEAC